MRSVGVVVLLVLAGCAVESSSLSHSRGTDDGEENLGSVASADTGDPTFRPSRIHINPPVLDIAALHKRWTNQWLPPGPCKWTTYGVGTPKSVPTGTILVGSVAQALTASANDASICGPVIIVGAGRFTATPLRITKPTIIMGDTVGATSSVLSATIANTSGEPLWMQDIVVDDAPFPGAIFASHWSNETTLERVLINQAHGIGIIQNSGTLNMFLSSVRNGIAPDNIYADPRVNKADIANGFGQPPNSVAHPISKAPVPARLTSVVDLATADLGVNGSSLRKYVAVQQVSNRPYTPWMITDICSGTGTVIRSGLVDIAATNYLGNHGAGLAVFDAFVTGLNLGTGFNGITPHNDSNNNITNLLYGNGCFGGVHVHDGGGMIVEGGGAIANAPVGIATSTNTTTLWGTMTVDANAAWQPNGWGDGVVIGQGSYGSFVDLEANNNGRIGALFDGSEGNLYSGSSNSNKWGVVIGQDSSVWIDPSFTFFGNSVLPVLNESSLPVPNGPAPVPQ